MVRFIIWITTPSIVSFIYIYIPLWLDLLCVLNVRPITYNGDLHSTMVRFIILLISFTINIIAYLHSTMVRFIMKNAQALSLMGIKFTFHYG